MVEQRHTFCKLKQESITNGYIIYMNIFVVSVKKSGSQTICLHHSLYSFCVYTSIDILYKPEGLPVYLIFLVGHQWHFGIKVLLWFIFQFYFTSVIFVISLSYWKHVLIMSCNGPHQSFEEESINAKQKSQHGSVRWALREHLTPPCSDLACGGL